jgi:hypothetical protein
VAADGGAKVASDEEGHSHHKCADGRLKRLLHRNTIENDRSKE